MHFNMSTHTQNRQFFYFLENLNGPLLSAKSLTYPPEETQVQCIASNTLEFSSFAIPHSQDFSLANRHVQSILGRNP